MIKSRNMDPEAGKWSEPIKMASSTSASFAFKNPTANEIYVDKVLLNITTAAAGKSAYVGVSTSATGSSADNQIINGAALISGQTVESEQSSTVAKNSYVLGTLSATDATLDGYAYIHYKELTK